MNKEIIQSEVTYKAVRSSGAGGQNVNKVASKVVLSFNLEGSNGFSEEEKTLLLSKLAKKLSLEGLLILTSEEDRSQLKNKEIVTKKLFELLEKNLIVPKIRKATKIPKSVIRKRIKDKKNISEIKKNRRKPEL
ncbi:aminoacyl-tRNA hydrolase [Flavobacterium amnicola]|uniref:Aminoacyl-tRNA hydrolase n=1 Tax=Flavobacterium amnicola TaxID=2506422 RepID=A0A4Q1K5V7_9FLAO|nr:alternative ribosome rescue aminoacyl-tRNA hydrolase ArfB [Flavobacterium amnicola]RXR20765.1 aminoacyl-tRNA hydrolase [Flavobacterium amnicola]